MAIIGEYQHDDIDVSQTGQDIVTSLHKDITNMTSDQWDDSLTHESKSEEFFDNYDHKGAILFVIGLVVFYGGAILILIIAMIRRSRTELDIADHLRDLEDIREKGRQTGSYRWKVVYQNASLTKTHKKDTVAKTELDGAKPKPSEREFLRFNSCAF